MCLHGAAASACLCVDSKDNFLAGQGDLRSWCCSVSVAMGFWPGSNKVRHWWPRWTIHTMSGAACVLAHGSRILAPTAGGVLAFCQ